MKILNAEPGDIDVRKVELKKWTRADSVAIDIKPQIAEINIFEDLEQPSMIADILLVDSLNLVQDFPIIGEESITITYVTPGRENPTRKTFFVFSIENTGSSPSGKGSTYTIKAVTPTHYFCSGLKVVKTYRDTIDSIVTDILKTAANQNKFSTVKVVVEKTKGILPITIPSLHPFEAVDLLRQKAVSRDIPSGGAFVFFENQYSLNFKSIESLITDGKKDLGSKTFTFFPNTNANKEATSFAFRNILRYNHISKFDTMEKLMNGAIVNTVESFDLLTKAISSSTYKLSEKARFITSTDNKSSIPNSNQFLEKFNNASALDFFVPKDSSRNEDFLDSNLGFKKGYSSLINNNVVRILINGDNYITSGEVIKLNLPELSGTTERKNKDRLNSGNYLITKLRHRITSSEGGKFKHQISCDCARLGYK